MRSAARKTIANDLGGISVAERGRRHLSGVMPVTPAGLTSTTTPAGIARHDPDAAPAPKPAREFLKVTCRHDIPGGHPCFDCPTCGTVHAQSVCPAACKKCGQLMKDSGKKPTHDVAPFPNGDASRGAELLGSDKRGKHRAAADGKLPKGGGRRR